MAICLPLACQYLESENARYISFLGLLMLIGLVNAFQQAAVYGQASIFATGDQMAALCIGMGLSGILMNIIEGILTFI